MGNLVRYYLLNSSWNAKAHTHFVGRSLIKKRACKNDSAGVFHAAIFCGPDNQSEFFVGIGPDHFTK